MDYDVIREGLVADSRIGNSHTQVPGIDNDRGFGGTCFPKDLNSLICLLYTSPSPRDTDKSRMPSSA